MHEKLFPRVIGFHFPRVFVFVFNFSNIVMDFPSTPTKGDALVRKVYGIVEEFCLAVQSFDSLCLDHKVRTDTSQPDQLIIRIYWMCPDDESPGNSYLLKKTKFVVKEDFGLAAFDRVLQAELKWAKNFVRDD